MLAMIAPPTVTDRNERPERLAYARRIFLESPAVDELLDLYAVHIAPQEVVVAARIHPPPDQDGDWLGERLDDLDVRLRRELPEVGEVFIDVTAHHLR